MSVMLRTSAGVTSLIAGVFEWWCIMLCVSDDVRPSKGGVSKMGASINILNGAGTGTLDSLEVSFKSTSRDVATNKPADSLLCPISSGSS